MSSLRKQVSYSIFELIAGSLIACIGFVVMCGWWLNKTALVQITPSFSPMQFNAAFLFLMVGMALIFHYAGKLSYCRFISYFVFLFSAATFIEHVTGFDFKLDRLFFSPFQDDSASRFSRISINTTACMILVSICLYILSLDLKARPWPFILAILGSIVIAVSASTFLAYLIGFESFYGWQLLTKMAFGSSICLLLFSIALVGIAWKQMLLSDLKSATLGMTLPVGICFLAITLFLWHALRTQTLVNDALVTQRESSFVQSSLEVSLSETSEELQMMANRWKVRGGTPKNEWEEDSKDFIFHRQGISYLEILLPKLKTSWVEGRPIELQNKVRAPSLEQVQSYEKDAESKSFFLEKNAVSGPYELWKVTPLYEKEEVSGYLLALFDMEGLVKDTFPRPQDYFASLRIEDSSGNEIYSYSSVGGFPNPERVSVDLNFKGVRWKIFASYIFTGVARSDYLPIVTLLFGGIMTGLVLSAFYYAHQSYVKAKELEFSLGDLIQTQNRLINQEKLASLGALTAGIAHEIKNPLNFIHNFSQLSTTLIDELKSDLEKGFESSFTKQQQAEIFETLSTLSKNIKSIFEQGKRSHSIIQRILAQSRGKPGMKSMTDIHTLLDEYLTLSYHGMRSQDINFNVKIEKNYDNTLGKQEVVAEDLSRVFLNLFNNAYYALNEKKRMCGEAFSPELVVTTKDTGDQYEIKIHDNGTGIAQSAKEKIFTPFFTTKPVGSGTGLGLSLSRDIVVEEHKGSLLFESVEGESTDFILTIPKKTT